jgi:hypothetical protein
MIFSNAQHNGITENRKVCGWKESFRGLDAKPRGSAAKLTSTVLFIAGSIEEVSDESTLSTVDAAIEESDLLEFVPSMEQQREFWSRVCICLSGRHMLTATAIGELITWLERLIGSRFPAVQQAAAMSAVHLAGATCARIESLREGIQSMRKHAKDQQDADRIDSLCEAVSDATQVTGLLVTEVLRKALGAGLPCNRAVVEMVGRAAPLDPPALLNVLMEAAIDARVRRGQRQLATVQITEYLREAERMSAFKGFCDGLPEDTRKAFREAMVGLSRVVDIRVAQAALTTLQRLLDGGAMALRSEDLGKLLQTAVAGSQRVARAAAQVVKSHLFKSEPKKSKQLTTLLKTARDYHQRAGDLVPAFTGVLPWLADIDFLCRAVLGADAVSAEAVDLIAGLPIRRKKEANRTLCALLQRFTAIVEKLRERAAPLLAFVQKVWEVCCEAGPELPDASDALKTLADIVDRAPEEDSGLAKLALGILGLYAQKGSAAHKLQAEQELALLASAAWRVEPACLALKKVRRVALWHDISSMPIGEKQLRPLLLDTANELGAEAVPALKLLERVITWDAIRHGRSDEQIPYHDTFLNIQAGLVGLLRRDRPARVRAAAFRTLGTLWWLGDSFQDLRDGALQTAIGDGEEDVRTFWAAWHFLPHDNVKLVEVARLVLQSRSVSKKYAVHFFWYADEKVARKACEALHESLGRDADGCLFADVLGVACPRPPRDRAALTHAEACVEFVSAQSAIDSWFDVVKEDEWNRAAMRVMLPFFKKLTPSEALTLGLRSEVTGLLGIGKILRRREDGRKLTDADFAPLEGDADAEAA